MEVPPGETLRLRQNIISEAIAQCARARPFLTVTSVDQMCCRRMGSDSYPVFFEYLSEGNGLGADESPKVLYIVAALENVAFKPDKPALLFAWDPLGIVVVAPCNEPLDLAGKVPCEQRSVRMAAPRGRDARTNAAVRYVRSRRVISSALAETKSPALSCWAHSSL